MIKLIRSEVCSLTEQLSQALEKKQALMREKEAVEACRNAEWGWWAKAAGDEVACELGDWQSLEGHPVMSDGFCYTLFSPLGECL